MTAAIVIWIGLLGQDVLVVPTDRTDVPVAYLEHLAEVDEHGIAEAQTAIIDALDEQGVRVRSVNVLARDPAGIWRSLPQLLPPIEPPPARPNELKSSAGGSPVVRGHNSPGQVTGFLTGKTIYVSQGHGWYWSDVLGRWATQRGNTNDIEEDLVTTTTLTGKFLTVCFVLFTN